MTETFRDALGAELRRMRDHKGWTRGALKSRLPFEVAEPTIGAWEHGLRGISAERLVQVCDVLGYAVGDVLARVRARMIPCGLAIDLSTAARSRLHPVRAWARCWIHEHPDRKPVVTLDPAAVGWLARLCATTPDGLVRRLAKDALLTDE
jgi:transcriptional regulator with XRE-family HTH domain